MALALGEEMAEVAERWGRSAVEQAFLTDLILHQAKAELELAIILAAIGRGRDGPAAARAAYELYAAKGDRPGAAEAAALLERLEA